jgi:transcriptional regulator with XRE-family HTH domain
MHQHLRDLREDKDLNQKQIAEIFNIAQTTYSDYELGKTNIPIDVLKKMAIFFDTSIDYLLDMTDIREPYKRKSEMLY